jgi:hypothetical protein
MSDSERRRRPTILPAADNPLANRAPDQFLLTTTGRNLAFGEFLKKERKALLKDPARCTQIVEAASITVSVINQARPAVELEERTLAATNIDDIYEGLQTLGSPQAQLVAIDGLLNDPSRYVRRRIAQRFSSSNGKSASGERIYPDLDLAAFEKLLAPTGDPSIDLERQRIALGIVEQNPQVGYDEQGRVFPIVQKAIRDILAQETDNEKIAKLARTAIRLNKQTISLGKNKEARPRGLSIETRDAVAMVFTRKIDAIIRPLLRNRRKLTQAYQDIANASYESVKDVVLAAGNAGDKAQDAKGSDKKENNATKALQELRYAMKVPERFDAREHIKALDELFGGHTPPQWMTKRIQTYQHLLRAMQHVAFGLVTKRVETEKSAAAKKRQEAEEARKKAEMETKAEEAKARVEAEKTRALRESEIQESVIWARERGTTFDSSAIHPN